MINSIGVLQDSKSYVSQDPGSDIAQIATNPTGSM
jgi:hypothetical protein